ncbi:hypothetical protein GDO78_009494 [Eleutherodactylus coqui]|uniref:Uncharacterized protein n=1 Tax=Eleutherodactylus coqui TaxID=57060 RepID=A0A8J6K7H1_ELECQ|nr:hypothetical protein GDO78_009494 [Eleutherodactylus coqui]
MFFRKSALFYLVTCRPSFCLYYSSIMSRPTFHKFSVSLAIPRTRLCEEIVVRMGVGGGVVPVTPVHPTSARSDERLLQNEQLFILPMPFPECRSANSVFADFLQYPNTFVHIV